MKQTIFVMVMISYVVGFSQNKHKIWHFGENAGLDFNTNPPTALTNGAMVAPEGCSSMADENGSLLFYTNGETIYNKNHQPMANGTGLNGSVNSAQSSLIVALPDNDNLYYVFTTDEDGGPNGLQYSIVDISLNGGLGAVTIKNQMLRSPVSEKLTATLDDTGNNVWIVAHEMGNNTFLAYLLTPTGLGAPILSNTGPAIQTGTAWNNFRGAMKISPNGQYMCLVSPGGNSFHTFNFDKATGQVAHLLNGTLALITRIDALTPNKFYGVEFTHDSFYLFVSTSHVDSAGNVQESHIWKMPPYLDHYGDLYVNTSLYFKTSTEEIGALQLAPNRDIIFAKKGSGYLGVIENASFWNLDGPEKLTDNGIYLQGRKSTLGLPNFTDITIVVDPFVDDFCSGQVTNFQVSSNYDIQSQLWDFGDGIISDIPNPVHVYNNPGDYTVSVTIGTLVGSATETFDITIYDTPSANDPSDFIGCSQKQYVQFDLKEKIPEILDGQNGNGLGVSFHATEFDAEYDSFPLPEIYTNQASRETIYVRVFNKENPECFDIAQFDIEVQLAPILNDVNNVVLCDADTDGMVTLDLAQFNTEILNGQDNSIFEVIFYENETDAENGVNPILRNYTNNEPVEEIFFRIGNRTSPECYEVGSFTISVFSAAVVNQLEPIVVCDDNDDGISVFELGILDELVLNGQSPNEFSVNYYSSRSNAKMESNALDKAEYANEVPFQQTIFTRIQNRNITDCYSISNFHLVVNPLPIPELEETYVICPGNEELILDGGGFDSWEWKDGKGTLLGTERFLNISDLGSYSLTVTQSSNGKLCSNTVGFEVLSSGAPESFSIRTNGFSNLVDITVNAIGTGEFEYSIDGTNYQSSNSFNLVPGTYTISVRDILECKTISKKIFLVGYPSFFSPNGDGANETWNVVVEQKAYGGQVEIYDRYGKLLKQFSISGPGWDGNYLGNPLPSSDYWFRYVDTNGNTANGHFALIR